MEDQSKWKAKLALACFFALVGGIFVGSLILGVVSLGMGIDILNPPFPIALISIPINETIILGITLLFARYKGASLKELGLKRASFGILMTVSIAVLPLLLMVWGISIGEEMLLGPDPTAELLENALTPRNSIQLAVMIAFSLVLVGPCEELAFRGFVQKGFENSFGKMRGLLLTSGLFGIVHGLNTLYAIAPVFVAGLVFGYVWQRTGGNTIVAALMHGVYDAIALAIAYSLAI
ncbi:MAG: CPBP family intramembrane metalloprotease [Candidatus Bathyarchaeota archaeon]|nr:MAG: CPBP family intramembrane metalloprotease [Candidatus Bathyarchaeota archaeon]